VKDHVLIRGDLLNRRPGDPGSVLDGNIMDECAEVSRGHSSRYHATKDRTQTEMGLDVLALHVDSDRRSDLRRSIKSSVSKGVLLPVVCLRADLFWEPPCADPHAGWCGGWGRKSPGYPIYVRSSQS